MHILTGALVNSFDFIKPIIHFTFIRKKPGNPSLPVQYCRFLLLCARFLLDVAEAILLMQRNRCSCCSLLCRSIWLQQTRSPQHPDFALGYQRKSSIHYAVQYTLGYQRKSSAHQYLLSSSVGLNASERNRCVGYHRITTLPSARHPRWQR